MDYLSLAPGLAPSSRLGFGCGSVMGRVGREPSLRAIAAALDAGITHFDVARLYGYGEAEALLGEALRGSKRDRVVIASKFGLVAPRAATALRGLKPLAQKVFAALPGSRALFRAAIGTTAARRPERFSPGAAQASLEESLRALRTDYLDILFLHDCAPEDLSDELAACLDAQAAAGKIRCWGVASGVETALRLMPGSRDDILFQFGNSLCTRAAERLPAGERKFIAHGPFQGADRLVALYRSQPALFRLGSGREVRPADLHAAMLGYALAAANVGVVLCSMLDPAHLRADLAAVERPPFTAEEIAEFAANLAGSPAALVAATRG